MTARHCPHCHADRPPVSEAYCGVCREPFEAPRPARTDRTAAPTQPVSAVDRVAGGLVFLILAFAIPFGFNVAGLAFFLVAGWAGFAAGPAFDFVLGLTVTGLDVTYRRACLRVSLFDFARGGQLLWLPVWMFGVVWIVAGVVRLAR